MNNRNPQSRKLRELLNRIKNDRPYDYEEDLEPIPQDKVFYNSHTLYQEAQNKITAEQDIRIVREIALYYLNCMAAVMPDHAATMVYEQMEGV